MERWATFDCYGTLVDWNGGIREQLERLFGVERADELLGRFHRIEPEIQAASLGLSYREVLTIALEQLSEETGLTLPEGEASALARSLPEWPVFDDVRPGLRDARARGWRLCILSNTDRDLLEASLERIGVDFELSVVASEIGSYKPSPGHWQEFFQRSGADRDRHVHVGASLFHDIAPANELGLRSVWINRLGEPATSPPTRELPDLFELPETLDELVPA